MAKKLAKRAVKSYLRFLPSSPSSPLSVLINIYGIAIAELIAVVKMIAIIVPR
jgi:hypothetical protein